MTSTRYRYRAIHDPHNIDYGDNPFHIEINYDQKTILHSIKDLNDFENSYEILKNIVSVKRIDAEIDDYGEITIDYRGVISFSAELAVGEWMRVIYNTPKSTFFNFKKYGPDVEVGYDFHKDEEDCN